MNRFKHMPHARGGQALSLEGAPRFVTFQTRLAAVPVRPRTRGRVPMEQQERALAAYIDSVRGAPDVLAVVVVGSVARGDERPDSDVDVYLVVREERFAAASADNRLAWVERRDLDYP